MSANLRTDVTAVKFYSANVILAGIGSTVHVFKKHSTKLFQKINALKGQKIYGFIPSSSKNKVLVFGGKQFTILTSDISLNVNENEATFTKEFEAVVCDDWLHSAVWIEDNIVALLTAHNVVQKWDIDTQTLIHHHESKDNSILYSGLLLPLAGAVLVMAGTVFSEVIVHIDGDDESLHHLIGHKGVIFSISCNPQKHIIVTTSDDRSVRVWTPNVIPSIPHNTVKYWKEIDIICRHELYGHMARVMRSCITESNIVSVGEDSAVCFWDFNGSLAKKVVTHQNGCIWSVDADAEHLLTGGGDCGVLLHPLTVASDLNYTEVLDLEIESPKRVAFTARRNLIILNNNEMIYYDCFEKKNTTFKFNHESTYKLLSVSPCKQIIAVADLFGKLDVFVENCKDNYLTNLINTKLQIGKILFMDWASNRHLVFCTDNGSITVLASNKGNTETIALFVLPTCKERWLTACAGDTSENLFVFGDRCGSIHVYVKGKSDPVKSFRRVHGRYGPTSIMIKDQLLTTTGRDGTIKYFSTKENCIVDFMSSRELEFQWVEKFLDRNESVICGFQERTFVVYSLMNNSKVLELPCGGGHRSWDAIRYIEKVGDTFKEFIKLVFLKHSEINVATFQLSKIVSENVVNGSHSKEINCLKTIKIYESSMFFVSGGEDTTLRVSRVHSTFEDILIFKQLSNVRTLRMFPLNKNNMVLISAGGRAQLCVRNLEFYKDCEKTKVRSRLIAGYMVKGTDKERKGTQTWRNCSVDFDPETRIMDVDLIRNDDQFTVFAGCSDASIRVFTFEYCISDSFKLIKELKHHTTCILKTSCQRFLDRNMLVTCTTRGLVSFWDITGITENNESEPFFTMNANKSGINAFASHTVSDNSLLVVTGGDDNTIHLNYLEANQNSLSSTKVLHQWSTAQVHSSQITGLVLVEKYLLSASIDQRVTLFEWSVNEQQVRCKFLTQVYSDVADIQGMDLIDIHSDYIKVCVFGKGTEIIFVPTS